MNNGDQSDMDILEGAVPEGAPADPTQPVPGSEAPDVYLIPAALAQATLNYLAAQPYREVFALVRGFETLEPVPPASDRPAPGS
jgi:hypothetical protein